MKKIFALALLLLLASVVSSFADTEAPASANAGMSIYARIDADPTSSTDAAAVLIGKCSKGVYAGWNSSASGYSMVTMHFDGNRSFGSSYDATAIYRNDLKISAAPGKADKSYFADGWTAM